MDSNTDNSLTVACSNSFPSFPGNIAQETRIHGYFRGFFLFYHANA